MATPIPEGGDRMIYEDIEYADELLEDESELRELFDEIARYHFDRRAYHDRDGFFAKEAYGYECLALGHVEPGEETWYDYADDPLYMDGTHGSGWDGDILCYGTCYGWACTYCESEDCDYADTGAILWDMLSEGKTE